MIVQCPSCSTGYHLALPAPPAVLRCSRCREVVPFPSHRRRYVLAPQALPPTVARAAEPVRPAPMVPALPVVDAAPSAPPPTPEMPALDAALFGSGHASVSVRSPRARTRPFVEEGEPAGAPALVPLGLAAVGAAAAWFAAPRLAAWMSPLPFAVEPWMMGAAGAAFGLLLGGAWLEWRAGRR